MDQSLIIDADLKCPLQGVIDQCPIRGQELRVILRQYGYQCDNFPWLKRPLLPTLITFNPSMGKLLRPL